jgi:hypothetical protein
VTPDIGASKTGFRSATGPMQICSAGLHPAALCAAGMFSLGVIAAESTL